MVYTRKIELAPSLPALASRERGAVRVLEGTTPDGLARAHAQSADMQYVERA